MDFQAYLPIPFTPHGRSEAGVDCWGLVCLIYRDKLGVTLPTYDGIDWDDGISVAEAISAEKSKFNWQETPRDQFKPFDIVVLRILGLPWHVGVVIEDGWFIHSCPKKGTCIERLDSIHWKNRILSYHRLS